MGPIAKVILVLAVFVILARIGATVLELAILPAAGAAIAVLTLLAAAAIGGTIFLVYRHRQVGPPGGNDAAP